MKNNLIDADFRVESANLRKITVRPRVKELLHVKLWTKSSTD